MIDDDLENSGLRELIEKGREQGYITYADINDYLPDEVSDPDQLDEVIQIINDLDSKEKIELKKLLTSKFEQLTEDELSLFKKL